MDASQFDRLSRALVAQSRRGLARLLASIALATPAGFLSWNPVSAKKGKGKGKGKKRRKKKPSCTPQCAGKQCGDDGCGGSCGICGAVACNGAICNCSARVDGTDCGGGRRCSGGVCATPPGCSNGGSCVAPEHCCSASCHPTFALCLGGAAGRPCNFDNDCTSGNCVGFVCQA